MANTVAVGVRVGVLLVATVLVGEPLLGVAVRARVGTEVGARTAGSVATMVDVGVDDAIPGSVLIGLGVSVVTSAVAVEYGAARTSSSSGVSVAIDIGVFAGRIRDPATRLAKPKQYSEVMVKKTPMIVIRVAGDRVANSRSHSPNPFKGVRGGSRGSDSWPKLGLERQEGSARRRREPSLRPHAW